ncbi:glucan biosynthesis protein D [Geminicoccaceae bacterium 1502E]|nr:glucan biosynthesis protein D [Geminicoccaceae bacterium 1502E]
MRSARHDRRSFMLSAASLATTLGLLSQARAEEAGGLRLGPPRPFSFETLVTLARTRAAAPYEAPPRPEPELVQAIDYDAHGKLRFRPEHALWGREGSVYPVTFMHLGRYFTKSVRMHALEGGEAREVLYSPDYFTIAEDSPAARLPAGTPAFAGFWLRESRRLGDWREREPWVTFLGASYFRAVGELGQVGMSARGIALNVAAGEPEEFPDFTAFWIEPAARESDPVTVLALLEGPSLAGAYRFVIRRDGGVVMDVDKHLFLRRDVEQLGIAPLTSMFWYGEYPSSHAHDWRPEVHDSDGLAIWTGAGEHIWRPANNPPRITTSSFLDDAPRGFGLSQRDRNYDHYLDGVDYHRRPSCWIEPLESWGRGMVQLVEIPTDDEIYDNLVAFWRPEAPARAGDALRFGYRLHWLAEEPYFPADLARAVATRLGRGGEPGKVRQEGLLKFVVEFDGPILKSIPWGVRPKVVATASRGQVSLQRAEPIWHTPRWRAEFDLEALGSEPVDLRLFMEMDGEPLTETWLYQWHPEVLG